MKNILIEFFIRIVKSDFFQKIILIVLLFLFVSMYLKQCEDIKVIKEINEQNQTAFLNEIYKVNDNLGRLSNEKAEYFIKLDELKQINGDVYNELKYIKGDIKSISLLNLAINDINAKLAKILINTAIADSNGGRIKKFEINWSAERNLSGFNYYINGKNNLLINGFDTNNRVANENLILANSVNLDSFKLNLDIIAYTIVDENGKIKSGAKPKSTNPGISIVNTTYNIDPRIQDAWKMYTSGNKSSEPWFTYGFGLQAGYGIKEISKEGKIVYGPYIGIGANIGLNLFKPFDLIKSTIKK